MDIMEMSVGADKTITFVFIYFFLFWGTGRAIGRQENSIREFYLPLREKYKRSYIDANRVVKFVRTFYGLKKDYGTHWVTCLLHYLQIAMASIPILMFLVFIFLPSENSLFLLEISVLIPGGIIMTILIPFALLQFIRCVIIKKTNPKYSQCKFHNRYG